ncbi:MAG TPA: hypothetical protein VHF45_08085 [Thermoleophilaceae bacterium]|nr:hypothetical protein [Thermoleophilaceae bacterium]
MAREHGQATIEWAGLVVLAAVAVTALAALRPDVDGRALGGSVAHAITCAARGGCDVGRQQQRRPQAPPPSAAQPPARLPSAGPPPGGRAAPIRADRAATPFQVLRRIRNVARKAWIVCLGYRRFVYERSRPRPPTEAMPLDEALHIANDCLNPLGFFAED